MKTSISTKASKNSHKAVRTNRNFSKLTLVITLLMLMIGQVSWGQVNIVSTGTAYTQNFNTIGSSATATLPTGFKIGTDWTTGTTATTVAYGTTGSGAVIGTSGGGAINWANGITASSTDRSIGFLTSGSYTSPNSIVFAFTNNTGTTISSIDLSWNYEKSRSGSRAFAWTFFHGSTSTATTSVTSGDLSYIADANNTVISNPPLSSSKSFSITGLSIANGATYYIRWTCTGLAGSTNSQGLSIDDFSITGNASVSSYTVTYNGNGSTGGTAPTDGSSPYASAATVTVLGNTNSLVKTGYTFAGWNTAANGSGTSYAPAATFTISANTILYAQWTPNNNTITFDGNGSTGGSMGTQTIATAASANLTANGFTKTGYSFAGWATSAGGSVVYANSASYTMGNANVTLYAKWTANNNTITFDGNGSTSGSTAPQTIATGANANLTDNGYIRTGYTFANWNTAADGSGTAYANQVNYVMGTSNVTLYAIWALISTPTINTSGTLSAVSTTYGTASSATSFTVSGAALTENILITPPAGFEVSQTSGTTGFSATQSLTPTGGNVSITTVYVRLASTTAPGSYTGNVVLTSAGATTQNVATVSSTVSTKALTITGLTVTATKVYDATTTSIITGTAALQSSIATGSSVSSDGKPITGDDVSITGSATGTYNSKDVATANTVTISGLSLTGAKASCYTLTQGSGAATITKKGLTMSGLSVPASKPYDAGTSAVVSGTAALQTSETAGTGTTSDGKPYTGDAVSITGTAVGTYNNANVASATTVTFTGLNITGAQAGNYTFTIQSPASATITKATQTITFGALADKTTSDVPFALTATASSGLTVTYLSSTPGVATVSGNTVTIVSSGTTTITASQAGNTNYEAASDVPQTQTVNSGPCLNELFTTSSLPSGWSGTNSMDNGSTHYSPASGSGSYCVALSNSATLISPLTNYPKSLSFWVDCSNVTTASLYYSTDGTNWNQIGSAFATSKTPTLAQTFDLTSSPNLQNTSNVSFKIVSGGNTVYIDDFIVYCGTPCTPPTAPTITGGSVCNSGTVSLSASGAVSGEVYKWYSASTGGTALYTSSNETDNTYTTASISATTTYYVTRYVSATSCESATRTAVTATVASSTTSIAPVTTQNIIISTNGTPLTVTEGPSATSRVWKYGTTSGTYSTSTGITTTTYTPNFGSTGTYYVICETTYPAPCGVVTTNEVQINVTSNTITTSTITGSPFCAGSAVSVPYTIGGTYTGGNVFTAQLSNSVGSFASPTDIGTATSTAAGTISATIPTGATTGSAYRIRVISSTPAITGTDNGTNLTINATVIPSVSIAITTGANPSCAGTSVTFTPTPTNGGTPTYQWKKNGTNTTTGATYTTTALANNDVVTCVMTTTATCPSVSTATSSGITMTINAVPATPTAGSNSPICSGATLNLTSNATGTIAWTGPNSFTASTQNPSIPSATTAATGTYNVKSTVNGCASLAGTTTVTVNSTPVISSSLTASGTTSTAFSYTITASYTPTSYAASPLPAGLSINTSTGEISGNPTTEGTTNVTITATNACGTSTSATLVITISSFTYAAGDYRPTADYTNFSYNNNSGTTNLWEYYNGSIWTTTPFDKGPANAGTTPTRIIINKLGINAGGNTTKTYNDIIIQDGGELWLYDDDATPTVEFINANKKIEVLSGGKLYIQGDIDLPANGNLIVRSGGEMIIDQASVNNVHPMWGGVENFEAGSTVRIINWKWDSSPTSRSIMNIVNDISTNTSSYKFGNLEIVIPSDILNDFTVVGGGITAPLCFNNLTITNNSPSFWACMLSNTSAGTNVTINGDIIVTAGNFNFGTLFATGTTSQTVNINGNFEYNGSGTIKIHRTAVGTLSATTSSLNVKGNFKVAGGTFSNDQASDATKMSLNFTGTNTQLVDITPTVTNVPMFVKNSATIELVKDLSFGNSSAITAKTGSTINFGFNGTTPLNMTDNGTTTSFTSATGSTLKITSTGGISSTAGANGNVQLDTRSYDQVANFWYVGKADQVTGNGIATGSTNKIIGLDMIDVNKTTTLTNAITTTGKLLLKTGVLSTTATNLFTIEAGGSVHTDVAGTNGAAGSANSFVDGPIKKIGNTAFTFPTGDITGTRKWARAGISAPSIASTEYTAEYFGTGYGDNSVVQTPYAIDHVSTKEYWNLSQSANDDVVVKLFWEDATFSDITTCSNTELRIAHYNGTDWEINIDEAILNCGSIGDITTTTAQPTFSPFTIAFKTPKVLPIELLTFNAVRDGKNVNIKWTTASETNNNFFTVERSKDANNFEFVSNYPGAGNSFNLLHYNLTDFAAYSQKSYYRLKQTDYDGKYSFSNIVAVDEINDGQNTTITIGKVQNSIQIGIENGLNADYLVRIIDVFGRVLYQEKHNSPSDKIIIYMDDSKYARGVYTVAVTSGTTIKTNKIIW